MFKKLTLASVFILALVFGFLLVNSHHRAYAFGEFSWCKWTNAGKIECNAAERYSEDYFFDPFLSFTNKYPIFYAGDGKDDRSAKYIRIPEDLEWGFLADNGGTDWDAKGHGDNMISLRDVGQADDPSDNGIMCGLTLTTNCKIQDDGQYTGKGLDTDAFKERLKQLAETHPNTINSCDGNAPLDFITCPIYDAVTAAIKNLIGGEGASGGREGLLIDFLTIQPLKSGNGGVTVFQSIVGNMVAIANFFYIIVFLILIFASSLPLGLDNYTIKKTLPKFIAAVILTQFSYLICGVIIDFFNLLGTIVPNMIFALGNAAPGTKLELSTGSGGVGLQAELATAMVITGVGATVLISSVGWILIIILALVALVAVLVAFVFIILRYIVLYVLILIAPIAFASWVLPGTEKFFSTWWKNFIKLNAMFPLITGMLAVSILLSKVLVANPEDGTAGGAITLVAMVIPIVALLAIPKTLKWTTQGMSALAGGMMGAVAGGVHNAGAGAAKKGTQMAKNKAVDFGKRRATEEVARNPNSKLAVLLGGQKKAREGVGKMLSEYRTDAANKYAASGDAGAIGKSVRASTARSVANPNDLIAKADAQAGLARLSQLGGDGRNEIAGIQDAFRGAGGGVGEWKGMLGDAGVIGDLDAKAPELTGWGDGATDFAKFEKGGAPWRDRDVPGGLPKSSGDSYMERSSGVDIKGKGATELGQLGTSTILNVAKATNKAAQFGDGTASNQGQINWQAAASMASTPQLHPKDAETIAVWNDIGQQGVAHWEAVGDAAADIGDTAAFDTATANQLHAQTILTSFGG